MASREIINRVKIEGWRLSRVPIAPTETVYQGDLMVWDSGNKVATKATSGSTLEFLGMAETTNPIETIGSTRFLTDSQSSRINVIQQGLVEVIIAENKTIYPFDLVTVNHNNAQEVRVTNATTNNQIGFVDPGYGAAGKAVVSGDLIKVWLTVKSTYRAWW